MNKLVGNVATIAGAIVALLTLVSLGSTPINYLVSAVLAVMAAALLGVGWHQLSAKDPTAPKEAAAPEAANVDEPPVKKAA